MNQDPLNSGRSLMNEAMAQGQYQQALDAYDQLLAAGHFAPDLQNMAAMAFIKLGHRTQAMGTIEQALRAAPQDIAIRNNAGNIFNFCGYWQKARHHLEHALSLRPNDPRILLNLGQVYDQLGMPEKAARLWHGLLVKGGDNAAVLRRLVNLCRRHGDADKAKSYLLALLDDDRFNAQALYDWTVLNQVTIDDEGMRDRLEYCLRQPQLQADDQAALYFALAQIHHNSKLHKDACQYWRLANSAVGAEFDAERARKQYKTLTETIDQAWIERACSLLSEDHPVTPRMVFIVGMPRSGTTLVEQMLDCHPEVFAAGELPAMQRLLRRLDQSGGLAAALSGPDGEGPAQESLRQWRDAYLEWLPGDGLQAGVVTDKAPMNFQFLGLLQALLPNARFIFMQRHPLAVAWSCFTNNLSRGVDFSFDLEHIADQQALARDFHDYWQPLLGERLIDVSYEALVSDPQVEAKALLAGCGLSWDDAVLEPQNNPRGVVTASLLAVRQPINQSAVRSFEAYADCLHPARRRLQAAGIDCS